MSAAWQPLSVANPPALNPVLTHKINLTLQYGCSKPNPGPTADGSLVAGGPVAECEVRGVGVVCVCVSEFRCSLHARSAPAVRRAPCLGAHATPLRAAITVTAALTKTLRAAHSIPALQGTLTPFGEGFSLSSSVITGADGTFTSDALSTALLAFPPGCVDSVMGASVKYWNVAPVTPGANITITPVANLVEAYRRLECAGGSTCRPVGDPSLFEDVYDALGFPPQTNTDFASWSGITMGSKYGVSVYVLNQKVAVVLSTVSQAVSAICESYAASSNVHVQLAVQYAMVEVLMGKSTAAARVAALSTPSDIAAMVQGALDALAMPEADLQSCKSLPASDRAQLFPLLAKVGACRSRGCFSADRDRHGCHGAPFWRLQLC